MIVPSNYHLFDKSFGIEVEFHNIIVVLCLVLLNVHIATRVDPEIPLSILSFVALPYHCIHQPWMPCLYTTYLLKYRGVRERERESELPQMNEDVGI